MFNQSINELNSYWAEFFNSQDGQTLNPELFGEIPAHVAEKFQMEYYPEPFYGYLLEDMKNDILMPLINPGEVDEETVKNLFPAESFEASKALWNNFIKERHLTWTTEDFLRRETEFIKAKEKWRNTRLQQCKDRIDPNLGFLHTIEFFPFHSRGWKIDKDIQKQWMHSLPYTKLSIQAIEEISKKRLVKHIIGMGKVWVTLLSLYQDLFTLEEWKPVRGISGKKISYTIYKYRPVNSPGSLPIVICTGCQGMSLPKSNKEAVRTIREFLELAD